MNEQPNVVKPETNLETDKLLVNDAQSARNREIEIVKIDKSSWLSKNISPILALVACIAIFSFFTLLIFREFNSEAQKQIVIYILGILSAIITQIFGYYFGSSMGSKNKDQYLQKVNEKK
jgi:hypothetical protein